jgi:hypothetical protein
MLLVVSKVNQPARTAPPRRGVVLLVVIAMLVLFASVGLSFVYYAQAEANNTGLSTQAERRLFGGTDMDPELLLAYFLGQFTSGVDDKVDITTAHSAFSSMRGHDLATTMWGYNRHGLNVIPFNGPGRSTEMDADLGKPINQLINYTYFPFEVVGAAPGQKLVRDPGRLANRKAPAVPTTNNPTMIDWLAPEWNNYVAGNAPFTYADLNNVFLGQMNANGEVLIQSFWRPWTLELAGVANPLEPNDPNNPLWTPFTVPNPQRPALDPQMAWRKYATVRPLPWYNPKFKPPADGGGDVKNLDFAKGVPIRDAAGMPTGKYYHNDSIWMDLGFPTRVGPDGRKYKPLFAPLIIDLDGKVNLNIAGNYRINAGGTLDHASNFGLTPAEISLKRVLANPALPGNTEWLNILGHPLYGRYGSQDTTPPVPGRMSGVPMGEVNEWRPPALSMVGPPFYGAGDLDSVRIDPASKERSPFERISLPGPGAPGTLPQSHVPFPYVPTETYGNGNADERLDHPWLFNYFAPNYVPAGRTVQADDRLFPLYELEALWRHGGTGSAGLSADLFKAAPTTFSALAGGQRSRLLVTPWSMDVAPATRPGSRGRRCRTISTRSPQHRDSRSIPRRTASAPRAWPIRLLAWANTSARRLVQPTWRAIIAPSPARTRARSMPSRRAATSPRFRP